MVAENHMIRRNASADIDKQDSTDKRPKPMNALFGVIVACGAWDDWVAVADMY